MHLILTHAQADFDTLASLYGAASWHVFDHPPRYKSLPETWAAPAPRARKEVLHA